MGKGYEPLSTEDWNKMMRSNVVARVFPRGMAVPGGGAQEDTTPTPPPVETFHITAEDGSPLLTEGGDFIDFDE